MAIAMKLLPPEIERKAKKRLVELVEDSGGKMHTGFFGTRYLPSALTECGRSDLTYALISNTHYPSWGYEIVNGATTVWERWDSFTRSRGFGEYNAGMNSFCHYAFGSVCQWLFEHMAGIQIDSRGRHLTSFAPKISELSHVSWTAATYDSSYGRIACHWKLAENGTDIELSLSIPPNTTARAEIPCSDMQSLIESDAPLSSVEGILAKEQLQASVVLQLGSGNYTFRSKLPPSYLRRDSADKGD